jgi:ATP synthase protein I
MTTEQPTPRRGHPVLGPLAVAGSTGVALVVLAAVVTGSAGAAGAAIGTSMVCLVFAFGATALGVVARVAPAASLLVALLTYTLQVVLVGLVYAALSSGGALGGPVDPKWLSGAVIACTLTWITAQIVVSTRARLPIYELGSQGAEANVR